MMSLPISSNISLGSQVTRSYNINATSLAVSSYWYNRQGRDVQVLQDLDHCDLHP